MAIAAGMGMSGQTWRTNGVAKAAIFISGEIINGERKWRAMAAWSNENMAKRRK
jgi:hypothetical protein